MMTILLAAGLGLVMLPRSPNNVNPVSFPMWTLFFGRLHPIAVHLPVGVLILAGVMESLTLLKTNQTKTLAPAIPFVLGVGAFGIVIAVLFGSLLSHERVDFNDGMLKAHQFFCIASAVCAIATLGIKLAANKTGKLIWPYRVLLGLTLFMLSVGAHFGGCMVHGNNFATEYAPAFLRKRIEIVEKSILRCFVSRKNVIASNMEVDNGPTVYASLIAPILKQKCILCHNENQSYGKLRMDSYKSLVKGGAKGSGIIPGDPLNSQIIARLIMPVDNLHHMPPANRMQLSEGDISLLTWWVRQGASDTLKLSEASIPCKAVNP